MKFFPIYSLLTSYPFLGFSKLVFSDLDVSQELGRFPEVIENAKLAILDAVNGKKKKIEPLGEFSCLNCEEPCFKCLERGEYLNCNLCMKCFENCTLETNFENTMKRIFKAKLSVLTYIAEKMLVSKLEDWVRMRFAVSMAESYIATLKKEREEILRLVALDLGIMLKNWDIHVSSYLRASARIKAEEWRLINRFVKDGYVKGSKKDVLRVIEEHLRIRFFEKIEFSNVLTPVLREIERETRKEKLEIDLGKVELECLPPCMKEILAELQKGMNVPHTARFALTSFLLSIGLNVEEILDLFKTAPDFDEEKSRYQIEHIAGMRGKGSKYTPPSCDTMRTYQNCVARCNVKHPVNFYIKCKKLKI